MRGPAGRASLAAALLGVAALAGCSVGRVYRPASAHVAEDGGVRLEATEVAAVEHRKEPPGTAARARLTTDAPVRVDGLRLAASASEPCGAGPEPSWSHLDADGRNERPLAGDVAAGVIWLGARFPVPPPTLAPGGPAGLDVRLTRGDTPICLRVPLPAAGPDDWREWTGVFVGVATRGKFTFAGDGESPRQWIPIVVSAELPVGPGRASLEASSALTFALSGEAPLVQRGGLAAVASLGYELSGDGRGGPRLGLRLLRSPARTGWTGYRELPLAPGYGVDLYVSRWWSFASGDARAAWVIAVGLSGDMLLRTP